MYVIWCVHGKVYTRYMHTIVQHAALLSFSILLPNNGLIYSGECLPNFHVIFVAKKMHFYIRLQYKKLKLKTMRITNTKNLE